MMVANLTVIQSFLLKKNHLLRILVFMSLERLRFSKTTHQDQTYHQQGLFILVANNCIGETISLPEYRHVIVLT